MKNSERRKEECPHRANNVFFLAGSSHVLRLLWGCKTPLAVAVGEGGFTTQVLSPPHLQQITTTGINFFYALLCYTHTQA